MNPSPPNQMTDADIRRLRELIAKATPGPWEYVNVERNGHRFQFLRAPEAVVENTRGPSYATQIMSDEDYPTKNGDGEFIAACKEFLPALLDSATRLGEATRALEPFAKLARVIDGPLGPKRSPDEGAFQSGGAWSEGGERRTITWGDFRRARRVFASLEGKGKGNG